MPTPQTVSKFARCTPHYCYPTPTGDIPDYDHTHPILIVDSKVYNVDVLDHIYTSYEKGLWTPLVVTQYLGLEYVVKEGQTL